MARPEKKTPNKNHQILQAAWRNAASKLGRNGPYLQGRDKDERAAAAKDSYAAALAWAQLAERSGRSRNSRSSMTSGSASSDRRSRRARSAGGSGN